MHVRVFVDDEDSSTNLAAWFLRHRYFGRSAIEYRVRQGVELGRPSLLDLEASEEDGRYTIRVGGGAVPTAEHLAVITAPARA